MNQLTPWSWFVLKKRPIVQLLKNFPTFYQPECSLLFTRFLHWSLSWSRLIQSIPPHSISLRSILILFYQVRQGLPSGGLFIWENLNAYMHLCSYIKSKYFNTLYTLFRDTSQVHGSIIENRLPSVNDSFSLCSFEGGVLKQFYMKELL
jgi:hypothetical protein